MWSIFVGQRGIHDIDDEITFAGNLGYVFHDSCGIECGGSDEVDKLKSFIEGRAHTGDFAERLHVIWLVDLLATTSYYRLHVRLCISADSDRPLLKGGAEMRILQSKTGQGN